MLVCPPVCESNNIMSPADFEHKQKTPDRSVRGSLIILEQQCLYFTSIIFFDSLPKSVTIR
jgi:hypothetical protein